MNRREQGDFSKAGDVVKKLFDRLVPEETRRTAQVFRGWTDIVGSETAMHVIPVDVRNHALLLETDHPGWSQRIRLRQEGILRSISVKYPELEIQSLRIRVSDGRSILLPPGEAPPAAAAEKMTDGDSIESGRSEGPAGHGTAPGEDKDFFDLLEEMRRRAHP